VVGIGIPDDKVDFTITSKYDLAKRIFAGEVNAATAFIDREIKVDPMRKIYQRPRFTARAITSGNALLKPNFYSFSGFLGFRRYEIEVLAV